MSMDLLSNMLSALKNASMAGITSVEMPYSKESEAVAKVLKEKGFLEDVKVFKEKGKSFKRINFTLAVDENGKAVLTDVKRVSKPGRRVYRGYSELRSVAGGFGVQVVSTSRGVMTENEARQKKLGGEVLCEVR